jgi:hypothetical protein
VLTDDVYNRFSKIPSANSMGVKVSTVGDMCDKQQRDLGRLAGAVIDAILLKAKAGESDPKGVLDAILARRDMKETEIGSALLAKIDEKEQGDRRRLHSQLAASYREHRRAGDKQTSRQILSMAVSVAGIEDDDVMRLYSSR